MTAALLSHSSAPAASASGDYLQDFAAAVETVRAALVTPETVREVLGGAHRQGAEQQLLANSAAVSVLASALDRMASDELERLERLFSVKAAAAVAAAAAGLGESTGPGCCGHRSEGCGHRSEGCGRCGRRSSAGSEDASARPEGEAGGPSVDAAAAWHGCFGHASVAVGPGSDLVVTGVLGRSHVLVHRLGFFEGDLSEHTLHRKVPYCNQR